MHEQNSHDVRYLITYVLCSILIIPQFFSTDILAQLPSNKINIAVITLKNASGVEPGEAEVISDRLRAELFNTGKVNVMERDQMQEILKEQGFQASGACTDDACMVEMGQMLGVKGLVSGSIGKLGSMFLVNLRMIDVQTGRISKAVSRDISGGIEEVVGHIRSIALELVAVDIKKSPKEVEKSEPEKKTLPPEDRKVEEEESKEEPLEEVNLDGTDDDKNGNRSGIRLGFNVFGDHFEQEMHLTFYDEYYDKTGDTITYLEDSDFDEITRNNFLNPNILFKIRAGQIFAIDVGFGWTGGSTKYTNYSWFGDSSESWEDRLNIFSFTTGLNFVKRWYPFKMNVGIMLDLSYLYFKEDYTLASDNWGTINDTTFIYHAFSAGPGLKIGGEILAGPHVGFSTEFVFRYERFTLFPFDEIDLEDENSGAYAGYVEQKRKVRLPLAALGLGINFYY